MRITNTTKLSVGLLLLWGLSQAPSAEEIMAAVAANFTRPFQELAEKFEADSGNKVTLSFNSTGKLYTEITDEGAPYDVFFAADIEHPQKLVDNKQAVTDSLFVYALGKLVLWSKDPARVDSEGEVLAKGDFVRLALPDPKNAPYGRAAEQVFAKRGLTEKLKDKITKVGTLVQAYNLAATGNAELALIALSQLKEGGISEGSMWIVPTDLYEPIKQGAVILQTAEDKKAVKDFMNFMRSPEARAVIEKYGYGLE